MLNLLTNKEVLHMGINYEDDVVPYDDLFEDAHGNEVKDYITTDRNGCNIHTFVSDLGVRSQVKDSIDLKYWMHDGHQFCPHCEREIPYVEEEGEYMCDECGYSISLKDAEDGEGFPSIEAVYEYKDW